MKQTAVEWLKMKMATSPKEEMVENINVWFAKAEEMEKEQIEMAFFKGKTFGMNLPDGLTAEQYYNKTFKSE